MVEVGIFDSLRRRGRRGPSAGASRSGGQADTRYLQEWAAARRGVEAFVEPKTTVTDTTVVLVAHDGEWTRRRIGSFDAAQRFGHKNTIPVYEVARVGYPQRMRDYTERQKRRPGS
ncbi:oxidoreductase [Amycolatopsis halotolerans]|uniref:Oxidoreductase n=1 Tax=Amycolatopsis halotolerans TaxID=330083 RepID=A0ABV7QQG4_9PSEU